MIIRKITLALLGVALCSPIFGATTSVDGIDIYWTSEGEGPAIIFVHGWTHNSTAWDEQIEAFKDDYRVITLDLPGHGMSGLAENEGYTKDLQARSIEAVRVAANVEKMVLVGHSMGGQVVAQYALNYPDRVAGLVGADTGLGSNRVSGPRPQRPRLSEEERAGLAQRTPNMTPRERRIRRMFTDDTPEELQNEILSIMLSTPDELASVVGGGETFGPVNGRTIGAPASVIWAGSRQGFDAEESEALWGFIPRAKVEKIPGTGHFLMMEKPQEFNARLREFLEGIEF